MNFQEKFNRIVDKNNSLLCIGLDPDIEKMPPHLLKKKQLLFAFNKAIIDTTADLVCAYKPNSAFYEAHGADGVEQLKKTVTYLKHTHPHIPIILDAKRADVESTSEKYAQSVFDYFGFDALTVNPYLGFDSLKPFLERREKGIIIVCRTSNKSASDFQDLPTHSVQLPGVSDPPAGEASRTPREPVEPLYLAIAKKVIEWNNIYKNCLLVVGATWPEQLRTLRMVAPDMFFLIPGIGSQSGDLKKTITYGLRQDKSGLIINVSRAIIYAGDGKDFAKHIREKAKQIKNLINTYRTA